MRACDLLGRQNLLNESELIANLRRHRRPRAIARHRPCSPWYADHDMGPEHAVDLDLVGLREPSFKVEPPAFLPSQLLYR